MLEALLHLVSLVKSIEICPSSSSSPKRGLFRRLRSYPAAASGKSPNSRLTAAEFALAAVFVYGPLFLK